VGGIFEETEYPASLVGFERAIVPLEIGGPAGGTPTSQGSRPEKGSRIRSCHVQSQTGSSSEDDHTPFSYECCDLNESEFELQESRQDGGHFIHIANV